MKNEKVTGFSAAPANMAAPTAWRGVSFLQIHCFKINGQIVINIRRNGIGKIWERRMNQMSLKTSWITGSRMEKSVP